MLSRQRGGVVPAERKADETRHFHALALAGAPARLLVFPGENALISTLAHQRLKLETELAWFDRWLGRP